MPVILITGATSGIGKATAWCFARAGWDVILTGRRAQRLQMIQEQLQSEFGSRVMSLCFDVSHRQQVEQALNSLPDDFKSVDVLVNNAGLAQGLALIHEGNPDDWEVMINTNIKGLLYVSRVILPWMVQRKQGHIINISSIAGKEVYPKGNIYCSTKFAVDAISKAMRIDLLEHGIKVTNINPGAVETEFSLVRFKGDAERAARSYKGYEPLQAEDVAEVIYFAATRPAHVCLNEITMTPQAQANTYLIVKKTDG
jgi:NADP-dependent 3-hydroxy acid dehydrogenase YdfG